MTSSELLKRESVESTPRLPANASGQLERAYSECKKIAKEHARNFYYSFITLPKPQRQAMCALYTFMRLTDDLGDGEEPLEFRRQALSEWREKLSAALGGRTLDELWWPALVDTVQRFQFSEDHLFTAIEGVTSDLTTNRYAKFADLYLYCYQVASVVGLCSIRVWGVKDPAAEIYAEWLGIAFQLTNIVRDVVEDAGRGRIYLPSEDLQRFGLTEADIPVTPGLLNEESSQRWFDLLRFEVARANDYYVRAKPLEKYLVGQARAVHRVIVDIYQGLLLKIEKNPLAIFEGRVRLSGFRKTFLMVRGLAARWKRQSSEISISTDFAN